MEPCEVNPEPRLADINTAGRRWRLFTYLMNAALAVLDPKGRAVFLRVWNLGLRRLAHLEAADRLKREYGREGGRP